MTLYPLVKYLTLIRTIALLHQYQRPHRSIEHQGKRIDYIEVNRGDIAMDQSSTIEFAQYRKDAARRMNVFDVIFLGRGRDLAVGARGTGG